MHIYAMTMTLNFVDGADVATEEGSKDVTLYSTGRRSCDAVTE